MDYQIFISLITLIALEVVLGIDNVIFISIIANKLPAEQQKKSKAMGLNFSCCNAYWFTSANFNYNEVR